MQVEKLSPMMQQYFAIKKDYEDTLLFFRLGDFYEMFFSDAITASRELEITLTGRDCGQEERAPMCGVPYHSAESYISKLVKKGYKVAICEQVTDPKLTKGIVERAVVRIITPGTFSDTGSLDEKTNHYLASAYLTNDGAGVTFADITTGDVATTEFRGNDFISHVISELVKYTPAEILLNAQAFLHKKFIAAVEERIEARFETIEDDFYSYSKIEAALTGNFQTFWDKKDSLIRKEYSYFSLAACLYYIDHTQKTELRHIAEFDYYDAKSYLEIDDCAKRNLELTETMRDKKRHGSLFGILDETKTSMGARMLKRFVERPLVDRTEIERRLDAVEELVKRQMDTDEIRTFLKEIRDVERLLSKISLKTVNGRDLLALRDSFRVLPAIQHTLGNYHSSLLKQMTLEWDCLEDLFSEIDAAISENAPLTIREGNIIKQGYHEEIDKIRAMKKNSKAVLLELENKERSKTGIAKLKIGYNRVFGYYIEVTKSYQELVPDYFIRKQTLANCERYITQELKEIEEELLTADERITELEYRVFCEIRDMIFCQSERIKKAADRISYLDVLCSFCESALKNNYSKPEFNSDRRIEILDGRHPVVEKAKKDVLFVANDTTLTEKFHFAIITGPNMAGKSTYMRQVALICIMAQMGSFVPAKFASVTILDKVFTRVGASDDLAMGQSTFMVEMMEVSAILKNATENSLIILDEIGRGTSTYDGLSIAWAVVEYICEKIKAKTLFATHYHELTQLEEKMQCVKNYCVAVKKRGDDITFLRRIIEGGADDSYGVEVAKLAGIPNKVIKRAQELVRDLEGEKTTLQSSYAAKEADTDSQSFATILAMELASKLKKTDVTTLTPLEALNLLHQLVNEAKKL